MNVYAHGDKVFNLHKKLPISAMTCGMGNIGAESIGTIAKDLRRRLCGDRPEWRIDPANYTIEEVAAKARQVIFEERYASLAPAPPAPHSLEFWVGGYGSTISDGHQVWKVRIENGVCPPPELHVDFGGTGLLVGGQPAPVMRLVLGIDPAAPQVLQKAGMASPDANSVANCLRNGLEAQLVMPTMPVRDAIELADYLVDVTKRFFRFLPGADIVGGDTDIAVVTKYEGFKWIRRKHFYPSNLNPLETGHA
ncbi:hypothetical protein [Consotaella salsifontis]|nr:hypothetical protein [Consotaella salsifontis]